MPASGVRPIRAVVTDDEPSGRDNVRVLLGRHPEIETVAECASGPETIRALRDLRPDLLFLDVQLPGVSGVDVLRQVSPSAMPVVIFVTAHQDYAIPAFDAHAADYLLKPYSDSRFELALARAKERLERVTLADLQNAVLALARHQSEGKPAAEPAGRSERLAVPTSTGIRFVPLEEIRWIEASGDYARLHVASGSFLLRTTMERLARDLDQDVFVRVHRSTIANVHFMQEIRGTPSSDCTLVLKDGTSRPVSGTGREQLARALGVRL